MSVKDKQHAKPCWIPQVKPSENSGSTVSRYFGNPWMPDKDEWPQYEQIPLMFLMQLSVASLPEDIKDLLGGRGLFQFFYPDWANSDIADTWEGEGLVVRLVFPEEQTGSVRVSPDDLEYSSDWKPLEIIGWQEKQDFPHHQEELVEQPDQDSDDWTDEPSGCIQGDKLGGWPHWAQACERLALDKDGKIKFQDRSTKEAMIPFLQLDAGCFYNGPTVPAHAIGLFAGDGTLHVSVLPSDPTVMAVRWACG